MWLPENVLRSHAHYRTPSELEDKIAKYFSTAVPKRTVIIGRAPNEREIEVECPTVTGLCLFLGFESRQSFYDYGKLDGFAYIIKKAQLILEMSYEERLNQGNTVGAIFALKNMGWEDKKQTELTGKGGGPLAVVAATPETADKLKEIYNDEFYES